MIIISMLILRISQRACLSADTKYREFRLNKHLCWHRSGFIRSPNDLPRLPAFSTQRTIINDKGKKKETEMNRKKDHDGVVRDYY